MLFLCDHISLRTSARIEILDITDRIRDMFARNRIQNGQMTICSTHTTAFVALNESEPLLQRDMIDFLTTLVPCDAKYRHNLNPVDGRPNAHSHLLGLFMNASETILVSNGELLLGGWQSVFFIELDGPREERTLRVQLAGER
ncbi:secondary thiamine-phosphate synthase enzyme YjbQ [uncultured Thiocystis sp.]|jgi:secondary thiamine-phosphate synthase enzyme|uniref:secondary thiamine-phosphate synthase enzyme YjbQ n=1 Tax=uncultured Thiocystis sp. TaxID=1202134 RepID=UPI0025DC8261|nr:secondary thiamine-phosphate synthase enzyme YjbQ [uncultured Thiocystis sp.]